MHSKSGSILTPIISENSFEILPTTAHIKERWQTDSCEQKGQSSEVYYLIQGLIVDLEIEHDMV
jgi:hypothetical protein